MPRVRRSLRLGGLALGVTTAITAGVVVATSGSNAPAGPAPVARPAAPPPATTTSVVRPAPGIDTHSIVVVVAASGVRVYDRPDGAVVRTLPGQTELGAVQTLLTVGSSGDWWKVALPVRPNDATGWVRDSDVQAKPIDARIEIDRAAHRLTLLAHGRVVQSFPVAVGTRTTPTPAGRFYVTDNLATGNPAGAFGPYALGLSGHSDVLLTFGSGDGVLGIHGTDEPTSIGTDASHGCIRMRNADITTLRAAVPLGTAVVIR